MVINTEHRDGRQTRGVYKLMSREASHHQTLESTFPHSCLDLPRKCDCLFISLSHTIELDQGLDGKIPWL
jgi:hypothetical protein